VIIPLSLILAFGGIYLWSLGFCFNQPVAAVGRRPMNAGNGIA
jgi:hypothetical protein